MCFSAEASISAAVVLGAVGYLTFKTTKLKQHIPLALIPFLLAIQQFSEGMIWLSYRYNINDPTVINLFKNIFLTFAILIWPIYIPYSLFTAETNPIKKKIIGVINLCGIALATYFILQSVDNNVTVKTINHSIMYSIETPFSINYWGIIAIYSFVIFAPCFISSVLLIKSYGILLAVSWLIGEYFYHETFVSVWCFFSAILSGYLYVVIKANEKIEQPQEIGSETNRINRQ